MRLGKAALRRFGNPAALLLAVDAAAIGLAFYLAIALRFAFDFVAVERFVGPLLPRGAGFMACVLAGLFSMGLYRNRQRPTAGEAAVRVLLGVGFGGVLNIFVFYFVPPLSFGRGGMVIGLVLSAALVFAVHVGLLRFLDDSPMKRRVLVVGCGDAALRIRRLRRRSDRRRFEVLGFVAATDEERARAADLDIVPLLSPEEARHCEHLDEIVVALDDRRGTLPLEFLLQKKQLGVAVTDIVDFLERETERLDLDLLRPSWLLYEKGSQTDVLYRTLKRSFDLVFSGLLLLLMLPFLGLTALAVVAEDGPAAPILYRQRRVGRNGRVFNLLKFRSMRVDAELAGPRWAASGDDRITRVGRLIRRFRIDELPQLWNIIRGDMSVVGPRPERPEFVEDLARQLPLYFYRHGVRPGLTGWAQLNFPYGASVDDAREKLQYDLYYIKNTNIIIDLMILMQTLEVVVWGRGTSMSGSAMGGADSSGSRRGGHAPEIPLDGPPGRGAA